MRGYACLQHAFKAVDFQNRTVLEQKAHPLRIYMHISAACGDDNTSARGSFQRGCHERYAVADGCGTESYTDSCSRVWEIAVVNRSQTQKIKDIIIDSDVIHQTMNFIFGS